MTDLESTIDGAWETRITLSPQTAPEPVRVAVEQAITALDSGRLRVAEKVDGTWTTHQWLKKAVLLSFRRPDAGAMPYERPSRTADPIAIYDKLPTN